MSRDELAARLLATFLGELDDQVAALNAELLGLEAEPGEAERLRSLFRIFHTVKGAARVAGVPLIEQACHILETGLIAVREGKSRLDTERFQLLYRAADALGDAGQRIRAGRELGDAPLAALVRDLVQAATGRATAGPPEPRAAISSEPAALAAPLEGTASGYTAEPIRVQPAELDALLASTGDLLITVGRLGGHPAGADSLHDQLTSLVAEWSRAGPRLRVALERAGVPANLMEVLSTLDAGLRAAARESGALARGMALDTRTLARDTDQMARTVHQLRLRPFGDACQALPRAVRDVARAAGRQVELELAGQDVRVDRAVVDALREPLLHLVRNAVDHGVEPPAARARVGKPERGTVRVEATLLSGRLVVRVSDDGAGLDLAAIRARLVERGMELASDERQILSALFAGGLSTREEATTISGRGVGLDLVRATMERIGGSIDVTWTPGAGTTFVLECPPTPARIRVLLAAVGSQTFAIPTTHIERLRRVAPEEIRYAEGRPVLTLAENPIPFIPLATILGPPLAARPLGERVPVIILRAGERELAVGVERLLSEQELAFRPLERGRGSLPYISGGALLPTGEAALVLNPIGLVAAGLGMAETTEFALDEPAADRPTARRVLVVDDSITTRTLEQSVLEAAGYEVQTAVDGAAAWKLLQEQAFDLVVADVEMPRLDGFGLCEAIRASRRMRELPVILVTALESVEHRARGLEVGADAYLAKSSFDQDLLLETIRQLLG